ncbi:MAG: toll/interleukin-1 receptor domain-containing protein [Ignavibacteriaceae bacterium]|nr:toll/interleukin-1 receptor domain-containing protein [Ignavibacteriaceae bacterium]
MAQIFISHSKKDKDIIHFFLEAFAGTKVKPQFEEFEKEVPTGINAQKIEKDMQASNAVFVLLSENVEIIRYTRDWVIWEYGTAKNKDIWIFEPLESLSKISVVVPRFNHYALFQLTEEWRKYLRDIIESYDDSHVLPTLSATTGGGALLNEKDRLTGSVIGFGFGVGTLLLKALLKPAFGIEVKCWKCNSNYKIHNYGNFRCAICNAQLYLPSPQEILYNTQE